METPLVTIYHRQPTYTVGICIMYNITKVERHVCTMHSSQSAIDILYEMYVQCRGCKTISNEMRQKNNVLDSSLVTTCHRWYTLKVQCHGCITLRNSLYHPTGCNGSILPWMHHSSSPLPASAMFQQDSKIL